MREWRKILSRKFVYPIVFAGLVIGNNYLDNPLTEMQLAMIATTIVAFILGESYIDVTRINNGSK